MPEKPPIVDRADHEPGRRIPRSPDGNTVADQQAETRQTLAGSGPVVTTPGQWRGLVLGGAVGALIGAFLALPFAAIPFMEPVGARVLLVVIAGAMAGAVAGGVYWGGRAPELDGEMADTDTADNTGERGR